MIAYSALYLHVVLSQFPQTQYAFTVGRTQPVEAKAGVFSLHRVAPELYGGFRTLEGGAKLATIEKAPFDLAYLADTRSRLFARPPELELPGTLDRRELSRWIERIADPRRKTLVRQRQRCVAHSGARDARS